MDFKDFVKKASGRVGRGSPGSGPARGPDALGQEKTAVRWGRRKHQRRPRAAQSGRRSSADPAVHTPRPPGTRGASWKHLEPQTAAGRKGPGVNHQHGPQDGRSVSSSLRKPLFIDSQLEKVLPSAKWCTFRGSSASLGFLGCLPRREALS